MNNETIGQLVKITGEITEKKGSTIYLDDGDDEVVLYIKKNTGINTKNIIEGELYEIIGIIGKAKSGIRIMPRSQDDIIRKNVQTTIIEPKMPGKILIQDKLKIIQRDKKLELFQYLLIVSGGAIVMLGGLLLKGKKL